MFANLDRYKKDLERLIADGHMLLVAMQLHSRPSYFEKAYKEAYKDKFDALKKNLPVFTKEYQDWYSEALVVVKTLLPDRFDNFVSYYERPKNRKEIVYGTYVIEDYLQNLTITSGFNEEKVGISAALPQFEQQLNILTSEQRRFNSSLFDIRQLFFF